MKVYLSSAVDGTVLHLSSAACVPMSDLIWGVVPAG